MFHGQTVMDNQGRNDVFKELERTSSLGCRERMSNLCIGWYGWYVKTRTCRTRLRMYARVLEKHG